MREISEKFDYPGETYKWDTPSIILNPEIESLDQMVDRLIALLESDESNILKMVEKLEKTPQSAEFLSDKSHFTLEHSLDVKVRKIFHRVILHENNLEEYEQISKDIHARLKHPINKENIALFFSSIKKKFINWLIFHAKFDPTEINLLEFLKTANNP
jgi:tRNA uridine 5-carbamoylmethylation protein Kti12